MYEDHLRICHHSNHQQSITYVIESIQHRSESLKGRSRVGGLVAAVSHADCTCDGVPAGGPAQQEGVQESTRKERGLTVASSCNPSLDLELLGRPIQRLGDPAQLDASSLLVQCLHKTSDRSIPHTRSPSRTRPSRRAETQRVITPSVTEAT